MAARHHRRPPLRFLAPPIYLHPYLFASLRVRIRTTLRHPIRPAAPLLLSLELLSAPPSHLGLATPRTSLHSIPLRLELGRPTRLARIRSAAAGPHTSAGSPLSTPLRPHRSIRSPPSHTRATHHLNLSSPSREAPPTRRRQPLSFLSVGSDPTRFKLDPPWRLGRSPPLLKLVSTAKLRLELPWPPLEQTNPTRFNRIRPVSRPDPFRSNPTRQRTIG